ncbi:MAG: hypothetical protein WAN86_17070 [Hyphomicrobiaceae bacterium]
MAFLTADVVENPGGELPFKVVIKQGETVLGEWEVESQAEGEEDLTDMVRDAVADNSDDDNGDDDDD